jgi:amino acid transporter
LPRSDKIGILDVKDGTGMTLRQSAKTRSKSMSVLDGFIYNFLAMGVIFPWAFVWGRAAFPGANVAVAFLVTLIMQVPLAIAYSALAALKPVDGGDYVYQSTAFGRFGAVVVMSGFVLWVLQWVALSGWLFATLGVAPLFLSLGVYLGWDKLSIAGMVIESPGGILLISLGLSLLTMSMLRRGLRLFALVQRGLFAATILGFLAIVAALLAGNAHMNIDQFASRLAEQVHYASGSGVGFFDRVAAEASSVGSSAWVAILHTLGIVPIAWTSLQWSTYSVEQNEEIEGAGSFRNQLFMLLGSALAVAALLIVVATVEERSLGRDFLNASSALYLSKDNPRDLVAFFKDVLQPFPSFLAIAAGGSGLLGAVVCVGFMANAFQITCNCFIGISKIMVKMAEGGDLFLLRRFKDHPTPLSLNDAYRLYFFMSIPVIIGYNVFPRWATYTLGVTFACGYVFAFTAAAAVPLSRMLPSRAGLITMNRMRQVAWLGATLAFIVVASYLVVPEFGMNGIAPMWVVASIIAVSILLVLGGRASSSDTIQSEAPVEPGPVVRQK